MLRHTCWVVTLLYMTTSVSAQQTIYWKKDHIYNGPGGKEIATLTPVPSDQTVPTTPTGLSHSSLTATSVQLSWSASSDSGGSGLAGYKIYRQLAPNAPMPVGTVGTGVLSFMDQGLKPAQGYSYTIRAFDVAQNHSAASSIVSITTLGDLQQFSATGGTITYSGGYTIHTFTSSGTFTPSAAGTVAALVAAGGGGGAASDGASESGGGGGAGGLLYNATFSVTAQAYAVTVGAGGAGGTTIARLGGNGSNSSFSTMAPVSGGGGGFNSGANGGSGGGTPYGGCGSAPGTGTAGQGKNGGYGGVTCSRTTGGGGGGANTVGSNGTSTTGGAGGSGTAYSISGSSVTYAGGGGGGGSTGGLGGSGGGGAGGSSPANATVNTGGGGGGRYGVGSGGAGAAGIVILRYSTSSVPDDATAPTTPLHVQGRPLSYNQVRLDWYAATDAGGSGMSGYKVYRGGVLVSGGTSITPTTFTDTGLTANTAYSYTLTAVDGNGNTSTATTAVNVTTPLELLLKDDFNRPDASSLGTPWTSSPFTLTSFKAKCDLTIGCRAWSPISIGSFSATFVPSSGQTGITFWGPVSEAASYFRVRYVAGSLRLEYYAYPLLQWYELGYVVAGGTTIKVETNASTGNIKVYVDNQIQINYTDTVGAHSGYVALFGEASPTYGPGILDDFVVHRLP